MESYTAKDDTAMNGVRIKCNNRTLTNEHFLEDSFEYGDWITQEAAQVQVQYRNVLSCGSVLKSEAHQGAFDDDTALNGLMTEICHEFIASVSGFWALRPQAATGGEALVEPGRRGVGGVAEGLEDGGASRTV